MPVDLLHPLVADGAGRDDEGGAGGDGLHGHQAVRAVEGRGVQALLLVVDALGVLPQLAVHALHAGLVVHDAQLAADALEAIVGGVEGHHGRSGGVLSLLRWTLRWQVCGVAVIVRGTQRVARLFRSGLGARVPRLLRFSVLLRLSVRPGRERVVALGEGALQSRFRFVFGSPVRRFPRRALCVLAILAEGKEESRHRTLIKNNNNKPRTLFVAFHVKSEALYSYKLGRRC